TFHGIGFPGGNQSIFDMVVFRNELYVGGLFTQGGGCAGNYIMKWDGSLWHDVGGGMDGTVWCLKVYNDNLYAGGPFTNAGGSTARGIARWDGVSWHPLSTDILDLVLDMAFYQNTLYVATNYRYNNFAKYT